MGGFASQVQQPQTGQQSGKGGSGGPVGVGLMANASQGQNTPNVYDHSAEQFGQPSSQKAPTPLDGIQNAYFAQAPSPMGKGGAQTNSATSGQPQIGAPNQYSNTVGKLDNTQQQSSFGGGFNAGSKGKGA